MASSNGSTPSTHATGEFPVELCDQLRDGDELTISTDEWQHPFAETVELEIDYEGVGEPELEMEIEYLDRTDEKSPASRGETVRFGVSARRFRGRACRPRGSGR